MKDGKIEQRVCIRFYVKLVKSATETLEMLRDVFGEHFFIRTVVFEWHSLFKAGRLSVDDKRSGRSSTSKTRENVEKIRELLNEDRRRTIHELADKAGISCGVFQEILTENLNMSHIAPSSRQRTRPHVPENHRVCD
jgi:hypothetical protein